MINYIQLLFFKNKSYKYNVINELLKNELLPVKNTAKF